jgi:hypothetical protein
MKQKYTFAELEQPRIINFSHLNGLKLNEIAMELSKLSGRHACASPSKGHWLHPIKLWRIDLQTRRVGGPPSLGGYRN